MDKNTIIEHLKTYLEQNARRQNLKLTDAGQPLEDWLTTSMEVIHMVLFLEKQFGIQMRNADISAENFDTLDTLANFVHAKLALA
ncbi:MAG: acyl carrier protein [Methylococcaceae bacterium]|nr:MAG: acyl carrier protein [Methylococcaceae bacterium]